VAAVALALIPIAFHAAFPDTFFDGFRPHR
jgi:hypothetical protein